MRHAHPRIEWSMSGALVLREKDALFGLFGPPVPPVLRSLSSFRALAFLSFRDPDPGSIILKSYSVSQIWTFHGKYIRDVDAHSKFEFHWVFEKKYMILYSTMRKIKLIME